MPYGTIKIDTITFTDAGVDKSVSVSGLVENPTFTGNVTATGTISGAIVQAVTVTGTTANFVSGVYTTQISGAIVKVPAGSAGAPSIQVGVGTSVAPGLYGAGTDLLGISTGGAGRVFVDSIGRLGIGTSTPSAPLTVIGAAVGESFGMNATSLASSTANGVFAPAGNTLGFTTNATERMRIDSSGRLLVGTSASITAVTFPSLVQSNSFYSYQSSLFSADANGSNTFFLKSRNATTGSHTVVQANDVLGQINFAGSDGTNFVLGANIAAVVDGTPGTNDMPGRLVFSTTADGAAVPTERMRIDSAGQIAIGASTAPGYSFLLTKPLTGAISAYSMVIQNTVQPDVTANANSYVTSIATAAAAFTLSNLYHFAANQSTIGAGSSVTNQYGFLANSNLTGATNNYGFFSNIASGTGRWNFYTAGTADSYFASNNFIFANGGTERARIDSSGRLLVGTSTVFDVPTGDGGIRSPGLQRVATTYADSTISSTLFNTAPAGGGTLSLSRSNTTTLGAQAIALTNDIIGAVYFSASDGTQQIRAAQVVAAVDGTPGLNDMPGRLIFGTTADGSSLPTERMRIDSAGNVTMGPGGTSPGYSLLLTKNVTGGASSYGIVTQGQIQSDVSNAGYFVTSASTQATAFTLVNLYHFYATQGTFGVGSTVTNQIGFFAPANLIGATNNYGFFSNIPSGTNRWNFYSAGTADSYFASNNFIFANGGTERARIDSSGRLGLGTSSPSQPLHVAGNALIGATPATQYSNLTVVGTSGIQAAAPLFNLTDAAGSTRFAYLQHTGAGGDLFLLNQENGALRFGANNAERARIDSSGRLLVGTSSALTTFFGTAVDKVAIAGGAAPQVIGCYANNQFGARLDFLKSRSGTINGQTVVQVNDTLGEIYFGGSDGTAPIPAARVQAEVDGTPGTNDMPGRLVFSTTADGSASPTERMRIDSSGRVGIGTTPLSLLHLNHATAADIRLSVAGTAVGNIYGSSSDVNIYSITALPLIFGTNNTERVRITDNGKVGVGTTSPGYTLDVAPGSAGDAIRLRGGSGGAGTLQFTDSTASAQWGTIATTSSSLEATHSSVVRFSTASSERARITADGKLLVGTSTARTAFYGSTITGNILQLEKVDNTGATFVANFNDAFARGFLVLAKSRGATLASNTAVQSGDNVGEIVFAGADGTQPINLASINAFVDGTPGTNDMPGRLVFSTTADGAASPTEQLRISNGGTVIYNQPAPAAVDVTATLTVANLTAKIITSSTAAAVTMTLPLGTSMDTGFSGLYVNMAFEWSVINTGATNAVTVNGNTGHTIVGSATVTASNSGIFLSRRTAANTWVTYRLAS